MKYSKHGSPLGVSTRSKQLENKPYDTSKKIKLLEKRTRTALIRM